MVKTVYQIDRLKYDEDRGEWVRLDYSVTYESRFLHCLTDMSIVSNKLAEISERGAFNISCANFYHKYNLTSAIHMH
jgi:hypothetical protein